MLEVEENLGFTQPNPQILHIRKVSPRDAINNLHRVTGLLEIGLGWHRGRGERCLKNRNLFSHGLASGKSKIEVPANYVPRGRSSPGLQTAVFSQCAHVDLSQLPRSTCRERNLSSSSEATNPIRLELYPSDLLHLMYLLKATSPNTVISEVRTSSDEFGGGGIQLHSQQSHN